MSILDDTANDHGEIKYAVSEFAKEQGMSRSKIIKYRFEDFVPCPCCDRLDVKYCSFCGRLGFRGSVEFESPAPSL